MPDAGSPASPRGLLPANGAGASPANSTTLMPDRGVLVHIVVMLLAVLQGKETSPAGRGPEALQYSITLAINPCICCTPPHSPHSRAVCPPATSTQSFHHLCARRSVLKSAYMSRYRTNISTSNLQLLPAGIASSATPKQQLLQQPTAGPSRELTALVPPVARASVPSKLSQRPLTLSNPAKESDRTVQEKEKARLERKKQKIANKRRRSGRLVKADLGRLPPGGLPSSRPLLKGQARCVAKHSC